jgi:hypothetical protein
VATSRSFQVFLLLAFAGCSVPQVTYKGLGGDDSGGDDGGTGGDSNPAAQCEKMDIVFVVDDSGSMSEEQTNLATNFPMFANVLSSFTVNNGKPLDFRVAVTTTGRTVDYFTEVTGGTPISTHEDGDNGAFRNTCGVTQRWLDRSDTMLSSHLACRANVGTTGPGIEMPLLMVKFALGDRVADATNAGFLRSDALLAIVVITDENDFSISTDGFTMKTDGSVPTNFNPPDLINFLDTLKGDRSRWATAAIAADGDCTSTFGDAKDATRLKSFVAQAGPQGAFSSICVGDLTVGLNDALDTFAAACGAR